MNNHSLKKMETRFPKCTEWLGFIGQLQETMAEFPYHEFVEHLAEIKMDGDEASLHALTPDLLATWITHMSHGTRVRMEHLETAILSGLSEGQLLIPSILTRCHLEVAGFAAQSYLALNKFADTNDPEPLKKHILESLYSSAVVKDKAELIAKEAIPGVYSAQPSVMNTIAALQKFYDNILGKSPFKLRDLYSQLCDFSHPGIVGMRGFVEVHGQHPDGRRLQYQRTECLESADAENLLIALMLSMRGGHACAALMHCGEIIVEENGFTFTKPDKASSAFVWEKILQHPQPFQDSEANLGSQRN
jgi:hypothetical protein